MSAKTTTSQKKTATAKTEPAAPAAPPAGLKPEMEALLGQLRAGLVPGAADATRAQAATVCRVLLAALDTRPGQPLSVPGMPTVSAAPAAAPAVAPTPTPAPAPTSNLLDLVTSWARQNLEGGAVPPHQRVPYIGVPELAQMFGALGAAMGGRP